jgi:hypothetical protein
MFAVSGGSNEFEVVVMATSAILVLAYSAFFLFRVKGRAALEHIILRSVVDRSSRRNLIFGLALVNGMFLLLGAILVLTSLNVISDNVSELARALIFVVGASGILYMIRLAAANSQLTLENELDLRDSHPETFDVVAASTRVQGVGASPLYLAFPLDQSRFLAGEAIDWAQVRK